MKNNISSPYSFAILGLISGLIISSIYYFFDIKVIPKNFISLAIPGILFSIFLILPILFSYNFNKSFLKYLLSFFIILIAYPVSFYTVFFGFLAFSKYPSLASFLFLSGALGAVLVGFAMSFYGKFKKMYYVYLFFVGGIVGFIFLNFFMGNAVNDFLESLLYPTWQLFVGFLIGKALNSNISNNEVVNKI